MARKATARNQPAASWAREAAHASVQSPARRGPAKPGNGTTPPANWWSALPDPARALLTGLMVVAGSTLLWLALLAAGRHSGLLAGLGAALVQLLGWGAYPLVVGLLIGGLTRAAEGALRRPLLRRALPLQGLALWLVVLGWSRLIRGGHTGGVVGGWMAALLGLIPVRLGTVLAPVIALVLVCVMLRVTWSQVVSFVGRMLALSTELALRRVGLQMDPATAVAPSAHASSAPSRGQAAADPDPLEATRGSTPEPLPRRPRTPRADAIARADPPVAPAARAIPPVAPSPAHTTLTAHDGPQPFAERGDPVAEWALPPASLLEPAATGMTLDEDRAIEALADRLERTLRALRVDAEVRREDITIGPMVVRFGIRPLERKQRDGAGRPTLDAEGEPLTVRTRVSRILALQSDLALALQVPSLRMEAPVPGQPYVGVEVPNPGARPVGLREVLWSEAAQRVGRQRGLMLALGRDVAGHARVGDLGQFPHALIAGATGSGKSVCLHSIICSLLMTHTPTDLRLLLIDPKLVELSIYDGVPHLLLPVVTDVDAALDALARAIAEMRRRYTLFSRLGVRNLDSYRRLRELQTELDPLPWIVIVVDEVANLMLAGEGSAEELLCTLAQLARAAGIHLVIATQRPSVDVVTGTIKANFPARLAFAMASSADSRTILDAGGAEHLLGRGDMLFVSGERARPERIQGCRVLDDEIERVVAHWSAQLQHSSRQPRSSYDGIAWRPTAERSPSRVRLDGDDTIEARQAGGRTQWGWPSPADRTDFDEWR